MHHSSKFVSFNHTKHHFTRKLTVFDTILGSSPARCGSYIMLIQFYSVIQCNTFSYNASFFKVCIVQPHKASFYPQTHRFRYNFRFKSCPLVQAEKRIYSNNNNGFISTEHTFSIKLMRCYYEENQNQAGRYGTPHLG